MLRGFVVVGVGAGVVWPAVPQPVRSVPPDGLAGTGRLRGGGKGAGLMAKRRGSSEEERYWRIRIVLEFARVAAEVAWDVLRRGGAGPF